MTAYSFCNLTIETKLIYLSRTQLSSVRTWQQANLIWKYRYNRKSLLNCSVYDIARVHQAKFNYYLSHMISLQNVIADVANGNVQVQQCYIFRTAIDHKYTKGTRYPEKKESDGIQMFSLKNENGMTCALLNSKV